jgi:hypothetical protein
MMRTIPSEHGLLSLGRKSGNVGAGEPRILSHQWLSFLPERKTPIHHRNSASSSGHNELYLLVEVTMEVRFDA